MELKCYLCHKIFSTKDNLAAHLNLDHGVKYEVVDLLVVMQFLTEGEKLSLTRQLEGRMINRNDDNENVDEKDEVLEDSGGIKTPDVATKIMFWRGIESSPKQAVKTLEGKNFFRKGESSEEKAVNELLKRTLSEHLNGNKSADDTIEIFDEIFATTCDNNLNDSVDGHFRLLLDEDLYEPTAIKDVDLSASNYPEAEEDRVELLESEAVVVKRNKSSKPQKRKEEGKPTSEGKYSCNDCGKSFKFLTYLKGHVNSKAGCKTRKQVPLYIR